MTDQPDRMVPILPPSLLPLEGLNPGLDVPLQRGDLCPQCGQGQLDYNGLLELVCEQCGFTLSGGGGCT